MAFNKTQKENSTQNKKAQNYRTSLFWRLCNAHYAIMNDSSTLVMDIGTFLKKRRYIWQNKRRGYSSIIPHSEIFQISDQDNIGTLLRYVTSCYM